MRLELENLKVHQKETTQMSGFLFLQELFYFTIVTIPV